MKPAQHIVLTGMVGMVLREIHPHSFQSFQVVTRVKSHVGIVLIGPAL